jgi:hypothetical protein
MDTQPVQLTPGWSMTNIRPEHLDKPALVEHSIILGHRTQLHHKTTLSTKPRYMDRIIREVTDIELHPNNMNCTDGLSNKVMETSHLLPEIL